MQEDISASPPINPIPPGGGIGLREDFSICHSNHMIKRQFFDILHFSSEIV